jgi:excisionase family DNA binding protein
MASDALNDEAVPPPQKGSSSVRLGTPVRHGAIHSEGIGTSSLPALVDIAAVSQALGISTRQVRRFVADDHIPFVRVGHLIRFDPGEINKWLDARRSGSVNGAGRNS